MCCPPGALRAHSYTIPGSLRSIHTRLPQGHTASGKLSVLRQKLEDRSRGLIRGGTPPQLDSVKRQCSDILSRQHMKDVVKLTITESADGTPLIDFSVDIDALFRLSDTWLGKNILVTNKENWDNDTIIKAYRSQYMIEDVFKEMKDRIIGNWWPLYHWTDSKIQVHALYCSIALLLRMLMHRRIINEGITLSMKRLLAELADIKLIINFYPMKRGQKKNRSQPVLTKTSDLQQKLLSVLQLESEIKVDLG